MIDYPATFTEFKLNGASFKMYKPTLLMQSRLEDENITVSIADFILDCTSLKANDLDSMRSDQLQNVYDDAVLFAYPESAEKKGETKKPLR